MKKCLSDWILSLLGWKIMGCHPYEVDKAICAVVPHTSWVDVPLGVFVRASLQADIRFLGKKSLFKFPMGYLFRWLGGHPVNRRESTNYVDTVSDVFNSHDKFYIAIAPEGTRRKTTKLKSGYYWIAQQAQIAIIMVSLDYENREVVFYDPFYPTGNPEADMLYLESLVTGIKGKVPEYSYEMKEE